MDPKYCALILCYNEKDHIESLIKKVCGLTRYVLVVDDGSTDGTREILEQLDVPVLFHARNMGKGFAIRTGLEHLLKLDLDYVVFMDGDGQHDPEDLVVFEKAMDQGYDFICGNRMAHAQNMPKKRFITNRLGSWALSRIINTKIPDTMVGFRALKTDLLRQLRLVSQGFTIETEILLKSFERDISHINVPVKTIYHSHGENKYQGVADSWRIFFFCGGLEFYEQRWQTQPKTPLLPISRRLVLPSFD